MHHAGAGAAAAPLPSRSAPLVARVALRVPPWLLDVPPEQPLPAGRQTAGSSRSRLSRLACPKQAASCRLHRPSGCISGRPEPPTHLGSAASRCMSRSKCTYESSSTCTQQPTKHACWLAPRAQQPADHSAPQPGRPARPHVLLHVLSCWQRRLHLALPPCGPRPPRPAASARHPAAANCCACRPPP